MCQRDVTPSNRTALLGVAIIALAVTNFALMEGMGLRFTEDVYEKYEELGSNWILVEHSIQLYTQPDQPVSFNPITLAESLRSDSLVREALPSWQGTHVNVGESAQNLRLHLLGPRYNLTEYPATFLAFEGEQADTTFLKNDLRLVNGSFPRAPGEIAIERVLALQHGIAPGELIPLRQNSQSRSFYLGNYTVTGVVTRERIGSVAEATPIILAAYTSDLAEQFQEKKMIGGFPSAFVLVEADLREILPAVASVQESLETQGYSLEDAGDPRSRVEVRTNGELLSDALEAADRSRDWVRVLTGSALALTVVGLGFVTAAAARHERRRMGVLQALGFPGYRLHVRWGFRALLFGGLGGGLGATTAVVFSRTSVTSWWLGIRPVMEASSILALGSLLGVLVYAGSSLLPHLSIIRASAAENLRRSRQ